MNKIVKKIRFINKAINHIFELGNRIKSLDDKFRLETQHNSKLIAKNLINFNNSRNNVNRLSDVEFQVYSQWGDDGIIQYLIHKLKLHNSIFIEFGVENYTESNTRFLLLNNNWKGLIIDGAKENIDFVKNDSVFWRYSLTAIQSFITAENINQVFIDNGFNGEIGLLSIDIDGNDYHVWKAINSINPIIVIVEYNSLFGSSLPYTIPYKSDFVREQTGFGKLFYGSSLCSLCDLSVEKGYSFIGCNSAGNNAYFIRNDKLQESCFPKLTPEIGFVESKFREVNFNGEWYGAAQSRSYFSNHLVYNTQTNQIQKFGNL